MEIPVEIKRVRENAMMPERGSDMAAGLDMRACVDEPFEVYPGGFSELVPTGIAINIKDPRYAAILIPRSGLGHKHGIILGNSVGLIDADYQGEVFMSIWNRGEEIYTIKPQERVAQMVFVPVATPHFAVVDKFSNGTVRGDGGFGHSGEVHVVGNSILTTMTEIAEAKRRS